MKKQIASAGFYSGLIAFAAAIAYGLVQILQVADLLHYPLDDRLIYGFSLAIAPPFLLAILALHRLLPDDRRFWSHASLLYALLYAAYVIMMYAVQLATVIPGSLTGPRDTILTVKPHSFFWTLDALGYICMGISTLLAALALRQHRDTQWLRRFLLANGLVVPLICVAYFYPHFSTTILFIGSPWLITAPGSMLLLSLFFRKQQIIEQA